MRRSKMYGNSKIHLAKASWKVGRRRRWSETFRGGQKHSKTFCNSHHARIRCPTCLLLDMVKSSRWASRSCKKSIETPRNVHFWEKCFKTQASKTRVLIKFHLLKQKKQDFFRKPGMHPEVQYPKVSQVSRGTAATRPRTTLSTWTGWKSPQHHGRTVCVFVCFHTAFFGEGKFPSMVKLPAACLSSYKLLQSVIFQLRVHFHWFFDGIPTALRFFYWFSGIRSRCGMFQKSWSWLPFQNSFPECAMCKMQLFTVESIRHTHILQMLIHLNPSQHIWHISIHVHPLLTCSGISYVPVSTYTQIAHHFLFFLAFSESLMSARPSRSVRSGSLGQS